MWAVASSTHVACALCVLLHPLCDLLQPLCGLSQAPCELPCPLCMMCRHYVGCYILYEIYCILYFGCCILYVVCCILCVGCLASTHDEKALCGLLHPLCGLLQPLCMMHMHYVVYCVLFSIHYSLHVGCYGRRVGYYDLYACCSGVMWDVACTVLAIKSSMSDVVSAMHDAHALCGPSLAKKGNEDRERRQGRKTWNQNMEPRPKNRE